jgi:hypothetical protein
MSSLVNKNLVEARSRFPLGSKVTITHPLSDSSYKGMTASVIAHKENMMRQALVVVELDSGGSTSFYTRELTKN